VTLLMMTLWCFGSRFYQSNLCGYDREVTYYFDIKRKTTCW